jgi:hypothetical protein
MVRVGEALQRSLRGALPFLAIAGVSCGGDSTVGSGSGPSVNAIDQLVTPPSSVSAGEERVVSVRARNSIGAFLPNAEIQALILAGGGTVTPGVAVADQDGVARFVWWIGASGGEQRLQLRARRGTGSVTLTSVAPVTQRVVTLNTAGTGGGSVSSSPAGISCTRSGGSQFGTCSASYTQGTTVILTASPAAGSTFAGWSGGGYPGCSGTGSCVVTLSLATSVTATFAPAPQTLTLTTTGTGSGSVTSSPAGISCTHFSNSSSQSGTCSASYTQGTSVMLTASAALGSTFAGWSGGGCSGTGSCAVTLSAATSVTATFAPAPQTLTLTTTGTGSGSVTSSPAGISCTRSGGSQSGTCSASWPKGTTVTLTASPAAGSRVVRITIGGLSVGCNPIGPCFTPAFWFGSFAGSVEFAVTTDPDMDLD